MREDKSEERWGVGREGRLMCLKTFSSLLSLLSSPSSSPLLSTPPPPNLPPPPHRTKLYEIACESWGMGDDDTRQSMSVMASAAAWGLGQWDSMEEYVRSIPKNTMEGSFYQALLHIHHCQFTSAQSIYGWVGVGGCGGEGGRIVIMCMCA